MTQSEIKTIWEVTNCNQKGIINLHWTSGASLNCDISPGDTGILRVSLTLVTVSALTRFELIHTSQITHMLTLHTHLHIQPFLWSLFCHVTAVAAAMCIIRHAEQYGDTHTQTTSGV